ncbi:MAG TPA: DUF4011 domain-containing protein, partial [Ardenticatenaceae bacterium]|nr:DUF4011 domain-containing protein [Ardenticatenaceae bacterium]
MPGSTRQAVVAQAREHWMRRLIDHSRRNNLLYFRDLKVGTLDLTSAPNEALRALLGGQSVALKRLLPEADEIKTAARLLVIGRRALANLEEKGLETLFVALGMATWDALDGGTPPEAAVLLLPVRIEARGREGRALSLQRTGEVQANLVLLNLLDTAFGCTLSPEELLGNAVSEDEVFDPRAIYTRLEAAARAIRGFRIRPRAVLSNFSFQKMAMVKDLREYAGQMLAHDVIAAIAGDPAAQEGVRRTIRDIDPHELDRVPPENEFLILDADSSQQRVIAAVLDGQHGVIQGPPGTGKSQTIANLIAALAAQGRRILFVAEKRAALEVVLQRLRNVGLEHLALDLHGADISRRQIMRRVAENLLRVRDSTPVDASEMHRHFVDRRRRLNEHVARLHQPRSPSNLSAYELQGRLLRLPAAAHSSVRWRGADLQRLNGSNAEAVRDLLVEAAGFRTLLLGQDPSPWQGANLPDGPTVQQAMDVAMRLDGQRFPIFRALLNTLNDATALKAPASLDEANSLLDLVLDVEATLTLYSDGIFERDLDALAQALAPAARGWVSGMLARAPSSAYRQARSQGQGLRRGPARSDRQLFQEIEAAANQKQRWQALSLKPPRPTIPPALGELV